MLKTHKAVDVANHIQGGQKTGAVVGVHGVNRPGFDEMAVSMAEQFSRAVGEFKRKLDIGTGNAPCPVKQKILIPTRLLSQ